MALEMCSELNKSVVEVACLVPACQHKLDTLAAAAWQEVAGRHWHTCLRQQLHVSRIMSRHTVLSHAHHVVTEISEFERSEQVSFDGLKHFEAERCPVRALKICGHGSAQLPGMLGTRAVGDTCFTKDKVCVLSGCKWERHHRCWRMDVLRGKTSI